jgi:hypothetical protein
MEQLFYLFPASAIRVGETWTIESKQKGDIQFDVVTTYTLQNVRDGIAFIESDGTMTNDKNATVVMGQTVTGNLSGKQEGNYQVDVVSGMLLTSEIHSTVKGTLQIIGREVPVVVKNTTTAKGKKIP